MQIFYRNTSVPYVYDDDIRSLKIQDISREREINVVINTSKLNLFIPRK